jgi:hypothetical protein
VINLKINKIPVPEIYKSSADFRFFLNLFATALEKIKYDIENLPDRVVEQTMQRLIPMIDDVMDEFRRIDSNLI